MRILLDTHVFLWRVSDLPELGSSLLELLDDPENEVVYSAVVSLEIAAKRAKGKLQFSGSPMMVARRIGLTELPVSSEHCEAAAELPAHHYDPFDRLLIAQAQVEGLVLATRDPFMARYGIRMLRA